MALCYSFICTQHMPLYSLFLKIIVHTQIHRHCFQIFIYIQTTSVHALARQLLGSAYSNGVLELNASDSRGIDVSYRMTYHFHDFSAFWHMDTLMYQLKMINRVYRLLGIRSRGLQWTRWIFRLAGKCEAEQT